MPDWLRLAIGTLTRLPVPPPRTVNRRVARWAMVAAPVVGAVLALVCGLPLLPIVSAPASLVTSTIAIALLAWATRALHLDGLADTADALGSGKPAQQALAIARKSDIGPFGVVALVLTLLLQVFALATCVEQGRAYPTLLIAVTASRVALIWACSTRVPSARLDGLGALVAGTVPRLVAGLWALAVMAGAFMLLGASGVLAVAAALLAAVITLSIARRRFGGVTGDVLGAVIELSATAALVVLSLA